eukprot:c55010_g1_i1.p2 GENE.c55010_g1_i1~~c55010_g1_i1.p2  ORF type:complete len:221 (-),score=50.89 c55010_g1_i1:32-667(-)
MKGKIALVLLAVGLVGLWNFIGRPEQFIFDPKVLHEIGKKAVAEAATIEDRVAIVVAELSKAYPGHISLENRWIFNNAGGAMGAMTLLHASLTEYVIIFGTPIGTEGHTGRFFATDYFTILSGEQWAFDAGALRRETYRPGDQHILPRGHAKAYRMPEDCWALEYARGNIPSMLPFGIIDTFSSTLDFVTLFHTIEIYARLVVGELLKGKI